MSWAFFLSTVCSARSMSERMSPMPRMRDTMRSGWNGSSASYFSPTPINLIGCPVTLRIERAAPPRASPSILVSTTPVSESFLWNSSAERTASCPVIASATNKISDGLSSFFSDCISPIRSSSMCKRPAVSTIITSQPETTASRRASLTRRSTVAVFASPTSPSYICALTACATIFNCSRAAGRYTSTETSSGRCPPALNQCASFPDVVVLPEPCNPAISTTVGGCDANFMRAVSLPRVSTSSSRTILMTCSPGESAVSTSCPTALAWMRSISSLTTLKLTSASSSASRISRSASAMFSSLSRAWPRRDLNARCSFSCRFSNIRRHYSNSDEGADSSRLSHRSILFLTVAFRPQIPQNHSRQFPLEFSFYIRHKTIIGVGLLRQNENALCRDADHKKSELHRGLGIGMVDFAAAGQKELTNVTQSPPLELLTFFDECGIGMLQGKKKKRTQQAAVGVVPLQSNRNHRARHFH